MLKDNRLRSEAGNRDLERRFTLVLLGAILLACLMCLAYQHRGTILPSRKWRGNVQRGSNDAPAGQAVSRAEYQILDEIDLALLNHYPDQVEINLATNEVFPLNGSYEWERRDYETIAVDGIRIPSQNPLRKQYFADLEHMLDRVSKITEQIERRLPPPRYQSSGTSNPHVFYDPRRSSPYMANEISRHQTRDEAISALAEQFSRSPSWVVGHMGQSNDLTEIHVNLNRAYLEGR